MIMPSAMMSGNMIPSGSMDLLPGTGMDMMSQQQVDMSLSQGIPGTGPMDINMMGGIMVDPSMMGMYTNMGPDMIAVQDKTEIVLKSCTLTPPVSGTSLPPTRSRPPGCRTIFVGGLPNRIRENIVREIFERYGRIHTLRLSPKNFCHIRFERENSVDLAIVLSGYRLKLNDKEKDDEDGEDSHDNAGWIHVDYAMVRKR